jgi:spermidine synthase
LGTFRSSGRLWPGVLLTLLLLSAPLHASDGVLYEKDSAFGPVVITDEGHNMRALRFGRNGVRQSLVKLGDPEYLGLAYVPVALSGLALCDTPGRFLIVGLGGGTLPAFLRKHYPDADIDAVDINPEVAHAAKTQLGFREDARMRIHIADGRKFIEAVQQPYDVIFLDAFGADALPAHLTTQEFLAAVRRAVHKDGVVIGNIWFTATRPSYDSMVRTYNESFDELHVLRVTGTSNRILFALPRKQALGRKELTGLAKKLGAAKNFRFNPASLVERGWITPDNASFGGRLLTDANTENHPK